MMSYCQIVFSALLLFFFTSTVAFTNNNILYNHQNNKRMRHDTKLHVEPVIIAVGALTTAGAISFILNNNNNIQSTDSQQYAEYVAREKERGQLAYITPKDTWKEAELQPYNGSNDETGPILLAVKGEVYNVYKGRNFYGPGGEYHIMAGRDASRFLAKNSLVEESNEEKDVPLNIAERASLESWYWIIRNKYDLVGQLEEYDPKTTEM